VYGKLNAPPILGETISKPDVSRLVLSCVSRVSSECADDAVDDRGRWCCDCRLEDDESVDVDAILALSLRCAIAAEFGRDAGTGGGGWLPT
jgi:hypothetical protein